MKFALNVSRKIIQTLKNGNSKNKSRKRDFIHRSQKTMDIFNSVKTTFARAAAATKPVVKTVTVETQTEMTWPDGTKQPQKCAVEKQTTKVTKTSSSSQTNASQNDPIKLKIAKAKYI